MVRILGIDPGLRFTGWGIIDARDNRLTYVASGVLSTNSDHFVPQRLCVLASGLEKLIGLYQPEEVAVEETYVNRNGSATLKLGYARGVALLVPAQKYINVNEYGAKTVKRAVVGTGAATKDQVSVMIQRLLPGAKIPRTDAADALAIAICHAHHRISQIRVNKGTIMA